MANLMVLHICIYPALGWHDGYHRTGKTARRTEQIENHLRDGELQPKGPHDLAAMGHPPMSDSTLETISAEEDRLITRITPLG